MRMTPQRPKATPQRHFSRKGIKQYFFPKPISAVSVTVTIAAALIGLVGLFLVFSAGLSYMNLIFMLVGAVVLFISVSNIHAIIQSNPGDQDYDNWLEDEAEAIIPYALRVLDLDENQITSQVLWIHSIILPGSSLEYNFRDEVSLKEGKDGVWRSSVNLFTFFFPTDRFIAMYTRSINALDAAMPFVDSTEEYFYRDIISVSFCVLQDTVLIDGEEISYRVQQLSLRISNGDDVRLGGYLSAIPLDKRPGIPDIILPDTSINQTLADLRGLLRVKKQRGNR